MARPRSACRPASARARAAAWLLPLVFGAALSGGVAAAPEPVRLETGGATELACATDAVRAVRPAPFAGDAPPVTPPPPRPGRAALRIGLWGDSHTASASFTEGLLTALQLDPAGLVPTFVPATWAIKGIAQPLRATCVGAAWRSALAWQGARGVGAGLVALTSDQHGSQLGFDFRWPQPTTRVVSLRLHVSKQREDRSLVLGLSADGGPEVLVALDGPVTQPVVVMPSRPLATLSVRLVAGEATVHGLSPVYADSQRLRDHLDVFSIPGATMEGWRHADVRGAAFAATKPPLDLALLQYGTNDAPSAAQRPDDYALGLRESLRRFRLAYPGTRCVLIGPPDRGGRAAAGEHSLAHALVGRVQQQMAREAGCDFWNWQAAMGGRGSAVAGARRAPATVQADLTHLTPQGYRESGLAFGQWLGRWYR